MSFLKNRTSALITGIKALSPASPAAAMMPEGAGRFIEIGGTVTWISDKLSAYIKDGYQANDIVYAAVMMVMDKVRVAPWSLYKVVDEVSLKKYHAIISNKHGANDWSEAAKLRKKALEPIEKPDARTQKLAELLKWANERTTFNDLVAEAVGYKMITGNNFLWANLLEAGANQGVPQELFNLPAQYTNIIATRPWPQRIVGYQLNSGGLDRFVKESVMHTKYWNPDYSDNGMGLYGQSPLKAGSRTITRSNSGKKAGATQLENNGAAGIVYVDDPIIPASGRDAQRDVVKKGWHNEYTGSGNFGKIAFSGYKMGYEQVGMSLKDMDLSKIEMGDLRAIFNLWGLPSQLGNDPENKSYNNAKEAEKALTSRGALPHMINFRDTFNRQISGDWGGFKRIIADFDLSVYSELQENQKEKWDWVKDLVVPEVYKLELMGLDVPEELPKDLILVDGNRMPLADLLNNLDDQQMQQIDDELNKAGLRDYLKVAK